MTPVLMMQGALVEAPLGADILTITLTDPAAAEPWLTRLLGTEISTAVLTGSTALPPHPMLARLALVLWARRWWPASHVLRIPALDPSLLALEAAALTAELDGDLDEFEATPQEWFDLATAGSLTWSGARPALNGLARYFNGLDDERGSHAEVLAAQAVGAGDFALAAGAGAPAPDAAALATGTTSVDWARVPPGVLDAAEETVRWSLIPAGTGAAIRVAVAALGTSAAPWQAIGTTAEHRLVIELAPAPLALVGEQPVPDDVATAVLTGHLDLEVSAAGAEPGPLATTPQDRAATIGWVRARAGLPAQGRLLAEQAGSW